jgi:MoaA/NifB/PqqE/SkfB family radical SAM enzyme
VSITTNGTLVTRERISRLYKLGVDQLTLSIDSGEADAHDSFRGVKGTYDRAMRAVEEILRSPINLTINTMLTHENIRSEGLKKMLAFVDKNRIKLNVVLPAPIGRWEDDTEHIVTEEDKLLVEQILRRFPTVRRDLDANYYTYGCGAAKEVLYVSPEGNVLVCPFIHASLGNVKDISLKELRARALKHNTFSNYHNCCLAAEDMEFIQKHLSRCWKREGRLVDIDDMMQDSSNHE